MKPLKSTVRVLSLLTLSFVGVCAQAPRELHGTSETQVKVILQRLERSTSSFRTSLNSALVQSSIDQTRLENDINTFEPGFETAISEFRNKFGRSLEGIVDVESVLRLALPINEFLNRNRLNRKVQSDWTLVRADLNRLAGAYGVRWLWNRQTAKPISAHGSSRLSDTDLNQLIERLETGEAKFRSSLTEAFDQTGYDRTFGEKNMNTALRGLKKQTDQLRNQFDTTQSLTNNVATLLIEATPIDAYMRVHLLTNRTQHDWLTLRADINKLASAYDFSEVGGIRMAH